MDAAIDRPARMDSWLSRVQSTARRAAVWADLARVAWRLSRDVVAGESGSLRKGPTVNFVALRPLDMYGPPKETNPEYRLKCATAIFDIEQEVVEITTPQDKCKVYRQGQGGRAVVMAYGDIRDVERLTS